MNVYFAKVDTVDPKERIAALKRLLSKINPFLAYKKDEFLPVKFTVGDSSCIHNVKPELVKPIIQEVKKKGARPFLFDTSVIYEGRRQNAVDHLNLVQAKGFGQSEVCAPFIIADGVFGRDGKEYKIDSRYIRNIKIPSFIGMLPSLLVLTHITGHIISVYAGAIKNVAMGMACRATKQIQHSSIKPSIIREKCTACGCCIAICPVKAVSIVNEKASIEAKRCIGCGECICACKFDAVVVNWGEDPHIFSKRMVEVTNFILSKFKNKFFINFAFDITKECDCISTKDDPMIARNIGILASSDILSLEKATVDLAAKDSDFLKSSKDTYEGMLEYASKKGMGNLDYKLIDV